MADEVDTTETEGPKQTIKRLPPDREVGPFYPSGMSAPEAAMAGATANLTDEEKEKVDQMATEYGVGGATPE